MSLCFILTNFLYFNIHENHETSTLIVPSLANVASLRYSVLDGGHRQYSGCCTVYITAHSTVYSTVQQGGVQYTV